VLVIFIGKFGVQTLLVFLYFELLCARAFDEAHTASLCTFSERPCSLERSLIDNIREDKMLHSLGVL
jgi:hypothetical protein